MQRGEPIRVRLSDMGFVGAMGSVHILIFTGKDSESLKESLAPLIDSATVIHDERPDPPKAQEK